MSIRIVSHNETPQEGNLNESEYRRFTLYIRNLPIHLSWDAIMQLTPYITPRIHMRVRAGLQLMEGVAGEGGNSNPIIALSDEQTMIVFWALYFSTKSKRLQLELVKYGLSHIDIGELLRINFARHLKEQIRFLHKSLLLKDVQAVLIGEALIIPDMNGDFLFINFYPKDAANEQVRDILQSR